MLPTASNAGAAVAAATSAPSNPPTLGIDKTLEVIDDVGNLAVDCVKLVKAASRGALGFPAIMAAVVAVAMDVKELVSDAPGALPELKDVDAGEAGRIATASYGLVFKVLAAVKG